MSAEEGDVQMADAPAAAPVPAEEPLNLLTALPVVLKKALRADGLARGIREVQKSLEKGKAHLTILAADCDQQDYVSLVTALSLQSNTRVLKVKHAKQLGEWAGLRKLDRTGQARKVVACACVTITNYGEQSKELEFLQQYLANNQDQ